MFTELLAGFAPTATLQHVALVMSLLMTLDIISGLIKALRQHKINSEIGIRGLTQKAGSLVLLIALHLISAIVPGNPPLSVGYGVAYSFFELISIFENVAESGAPIPSYITGVLKIFNNLTVMSDFKEDE